MTDQDCRSSATIDQLADSLFADPQPAKTASHAVHLRDKKLVDALDTSANQEWKRPHNYKRPVITVAAIGVTVLMCAFACAQEDRASARLQSSFTDGVKELRQKSAEIAAQRAREKQTAHQVTAQRHDRSMKRKHTM